jgi:hypothetical protein
LRGKIDLMTKKTPQQASKVVRMLVPYRISAFFERRCRFEAGVAVVG